MILSAIEKEHIKQQLISCLSTEQEIKKIVIFGSFPNSPTPNDLDVAIFQDSSAPYLTLAMKYRKITREIACQIPLDIVPMFYGKKSGFFSSEIDQGETIYER